MIPAALDTEFRNHVANDVRGLLSPEDSAELRKPENIDRWCRALVAIKKEVEVQLANKNAKWVKKQAELAHRGDAGRAEWLAFKASEIDWRVKAIRFIVSIESHLAAAKELKQVGKGKPTMADARSELDRLREAIRRHRDSLPPDESGVEDEELWALLEH